MSKEFADFKFSGPRLEDLDIPRIGKMIGVGEDVVHAVMDTETNGRSTDKNGRIKALYEPHVAYRNSSGAVRAALVKAGLAYPKWKRGYPADSYPRIKKAMAIDQRVAFLATSWGFPQILGENYALAGYASPQEMVLDFLKDEDNQLEAMVRFIKSAGLDDELRVIEKKLKAGRRITADDARAFVRGYNGSGYERNKYHEVFADNANKWARIPDTKEPPTPAARPDPKGEEAGSPGIYDGKRHEIVLAVQTHLDRIGYPEVGTLDGRWGNRTKNTVLAFRSDNDMPLVPRIDDDLVVRLTATPSNSRVISEARKNTTVADLRKEGVEEIATADATQVAGGVVTAGGVVAAAKPILDTADAYGGMVQRLADMVKPIQEFVSDNLPLIVCVVAAVIVYQAWQMKKLRVLKHQTGRDVSE